MSASIGSEADALGQPRPQQPTPEVKGDRAGSFMPMPRSLAIGLFLTDGSFLLYWSVAALSLLGWINIPAEWMYANYTNPEVIAWNWSFFPLDLAFSFFGLKAVAASRRGDEVWQKYALISLTLTMAAGGMAVSYWIILAEFNPSWFFSNLSLVLWPLLVMRRIAIRL